MMQLSLPVLLCQCATLLVSLEGIVCPLLMDFVVDNFSTVDVYCNVTIEGNNKTGQFVFEKSTRYIHDAPEHVVRFLDISWDTVAQEGNCPKIVTFSVRGVPNKNYNIKFKRERQAHLFIQLKALPPFFNILWARIYSHVRPVIIAYDEFDSGDIGFKLLDNENYTNEYVRLSQLPYVFMRSDINNEIRTRPPQTLYLRNHTRLEDYEIVFQSTENLGTFLQFFPDRIYDDNKTRAYYFVPYSREGREKGPECGDASEPLGPSESHDTSESGGPSESHDKSE